MDTKKSRKILLSFDVEEFDMPLEYGQDIGLEEQLFIGNLGTETIIPILEENKISCTLFTTANYAMHFPEQIANLAGTHEIASHTYFHSKFLVNHLLESRLKLEELSQTKVTGLRMPRMLKVNMLDVKNAGYLYDSSVNPTYLPGRYNNLNISRTHFTDSGMLRIPTAVSPNFRIPLFWLAFKNFPYSFFKFLCLQTLKKDGYLCLYFHPWEFVDLSNYKIPGYTKKLAGKQLQERLSQLINDLSDEGDFITMNSFVRNLDV